MEGIFVQHQRTFPPPFTVEVLKRLLVGVPEHATVDLLDGELIAVNWTHHELHNVQEAS